MKKNITLILILLLIACNNQKINISSKDSGNRTYEEGFTEGYKKGRKQLSDEKQNAINRLRNKISILEDSLKSKYNPTLKEYIKTKFTFRNDDIVINNLIKINDDQYLLIFKNEGWSSGKRWEKFAFAKITNDSKWENIFEKEVVFDDNEGNPVVVKQEIKYEIDWKSRSIIITSYENFMGEEDHEFTTTILSCDSLKFQNYFY